MIRPATFEDAASIASVHVASWKETYTGLLPAAYIANRTHEKRLHQWQSILKAGHGVFVYETDGQIIGFADGGTMREPLPSYLGEIYSFYLLKKYHRQGIGNQLFGQVREFLRANQLQSFTTWVLATNPALGFYKTMGGQIIGQRFEQIEGIEVKDIQLGWH